MCGNIMQQKQGQVQKSSSSRTNTKAQWNRQVLESQKRGEFQTGGRGGGSSQAWVYHRKSPVPCVCQLRPRATVQLFQRKMHLELLSAHMLILLPGLLCGESHTSSFSGTALPPADFPGLPVSQQHLSTERSKGIPSSTETRQC